MTAEASQSAEIEKPLSNKRTAAKGFSFEGQKIAHLDETLLVRISSYDPFRDQGTVESWHSIGKAARKKLPHEAHAYWAPEPDRPDPLDIIDATNEDRQQSLIPLRMERMAATPFSFFRGAADIMAWDLSHMPNTGFAVVMCGDAHLDNFGLYGTPGRVVTFDMNDFDEAVVGPWEWDLKRLAASVCIAGREYGMKPKARREAIRICVDGYCQIAEMFQQLGVLDIWYMRADPQRILATQNHVLGRTIDPRTHNVWKKAIEKAKRSTNETLLRKVAQRDSKGQWRFVPDPPILTRVSPATYRRIADALVEYVETLTRERRLMIRNYSIADIVHRVVGVGSVGVLAYLALLFGNGDHDPMFLQIKEAGQPAHAPYLPKQPLEDNSGHRVVVGQRVLQASSDFMLGWTKIDGRDFYVRQMKNMKGSVPIKLLSGRSFEFYAMACGMVLARGHARTGDIAMIAGYCGRSKKFTSALAEFVESYADQNEKDHAALVSAIASGRYKNLK
jgi:uncharacterized protein (DUF2252 family)